ncbi:hypothetical protein Gohar_013598, partial [Gossypium harknessii]|nr:hypothetical protein [Gossypium harknessii]
FSFSFDPVEGSGSAWFWRWCLLRLLASLALRMAEDINDLLERLNFSEKE